MFGIDVWTSFNFLKHNLRQVYCKLLNSVSKIKIKIFGGIKDVEI